MVKSDQEIIIEQRKRIELLEAEILRRCKENRTKQDLIFDINNLVGVKDGVIGFSKLCWNDLTILEEKLIQLNSQSKA